jgi:hypothetical protein
MCILFYPKFLAREKRAKGMHAMGTHAFSRVTSVNPGACKYNSRDELWEGDLLHSTRPTEREPMSISARIPSYNLETKNRETIP